MMDDARLEEILASIGHDLDVTSRPVRLPRRARDGLLAAAAALVVVALALSVAPARRAVTGWLHIGRTGVAYVDLRPPQGAARPSLGSQQELLAAYSLVNSLCENLPRLAGVALLWTGMQSPTFAGNLDTRRPLTSDLTLVAPAP